MRGDEVWWKRREIKFAQQVSGKNNAALLQSFLLLIFSYFSVLCEFIANLAHSMLYWSALTLSDYV